MKSIAVPMDTVFPTFNCVQKSPQDPVVSINWTVNTFKGNTIQLH